MFPFVQPYRWVAFWLMITVVLPVAMELLVPKALNYIIDSGIEAGDMAAIWRGSIIMLVTAITGAAATLGQGVCRALLAQGLSYDMRNKLFAHIQAFSFANLDKMQTGQLMTRLSSDVDLVRGFTSHGLSLLLRALLMLIGSVAMMFVIDPRLALITLTVLPLAGILIWGLMELARPLFILVQEKLSELNTTVQENLAGVQVVKAFVRERFEIDCFKVNNDAYMAENIKVGKLMAVALPVLTLLTNLGIVAVVWFGGRDVIGGHLTLGELVAFNNYLMIGMAPLMLLGNILTMVSRAEASAERFLEVLDTRPAVEVIAEPHKSAALQGNVTFEGVTFRYDGNGNSQAETLNADIHRGGRNVLDGITFNADSGQRVALLGATGSGKSTLVNLIPRFYDVDSGKIQIDGIDVRDWEPESLRKKIGVVLQQTTLFSGTIHENIAYGRPEASLDEVIAAAKAAQAHDFIMAMPQGYESVVEERGANLSGGQKQRIAIARALLISPGILILDDSTSAVDMETEAKIQAALDKLMADCTTFMIAQRISSVLAADQIIVLDHGQISAQGTHRELLNSSQIYQEIYQSQMGDGQT
ncbi:MAG: ABC transporter ATP-binding protein/permease [Chloroflexi bacterium]|nr:ABC transporter ATP-binding protein/permease [Chloroflexota bacterium]